MFLWFIGTAVASVWYVFRDPRFDYRPLAFGALLPDIIDLPGGQARWAHSLTVAVGTLAAVMVLTAGRKPIRRLPAVGRGAAVMLLTPARKPIRRLLLALPIGMLLHLVFDGVFASTE